MGTAFMPVPAVAVCIKSENRFCVVSEGYQFVCVPQ